MKTTSKIPAVLFCFTIGLTLALQAAPGDLDTTFGGTGKILRGFGGTDDESRASALQSGKLVVAGTSSGLLTLVRFDADNIPDPTFGTDGTVSTPLIGSPLIKNIRVQSDGKIVVAGQVHNTSSGNSDFLLVRYNFDGTLDTTFSEDGIVTRDFGDDEDCTDFLIQSDGSYLIAGIKTVVGSFPSFTTYSVVARFLANGSSDSSFNGNGSIVGAQTTSVYAILQQPDGKLLVGGYSGGNCVLRYNSNGTPDTGFGTNGKLVIPGASQVSALAIHPGNNTVVNPDRILVAGRAQGVLLARINLDGTFDTSLNGTGTVTISVGTNPNIAGIRVGGTMFIRQIFIIGDVSNGSNRDFMIAKLSAAGALDPNFGSGGIVTTPISQGDDTVSDVIFQSGRLLLTGAVASVNSFNSDFVLARYNQGDGSLDTTFSSSGIFQHNVGNRPASAKAVAIQNDQKIVVAGSAQTGFYSIVTVHRLNGDGSQDLTFGNGGTVMTTIGDQGSEATAVAVQPDGKILIAGSKFKNGQGSVALARYLSNGTLDDSFGTNGVVVTDVGTNFSSASVLRLQSDGKILVGGSASPVNDSDFLVLRYLTNGLLDTTWNGTGLVTTGIGSDTDQLTGLALLPDGKVMASGSSTFAGSTRFSLVRYTSNGVLDSSFGSFGRVAVSIGTGIGDAASGLVQQPDSKLVLSGYAINSAGTDADIAVARFTTNGVLDTAFSGDGKVIESIGLGIDLGVAADVQADNKILIGSRTQIGSNYRFGTIRLLANGSVDTDYGSGGRTFYDFGTTADEMVNAMAIDAAGRAVLVGDAGGVFGILRTMGDTVALSITSITRLSNGDIMLQGAGVPNGGHTLLQTGILPGGFTTLAPVTADALGNWEYQDIGTSAAGNRFYQISYP